ADAALVDCGFILDRRGMTCGVVDARNGREQDIAVFCSKGPAGWRKGSRDEWWTSWLYRGRRGIGPFDRKIFADEVEWRLSPDLTGEDNGPLLALVVTLLDTDVLGIEHCEIVLIPTADDIQPSASSRSVVDSRCGACGPGWVQN